MTLICADTKFLGCNTSINPKDLGPGLGESVSNLDNDHGDLRGRRAALTVHTLTGYGSTQQQSIYRAGRETASDTQYWYAFTIDVDFARSLLANDPTERVYGTGGVLSRPYYTDNTFHAGGPPYPTGGYRLGVPAPAAGMTAAINTAGEGSNQTRLYVSTYLRYNDDESAPSDPVKIVVPGGSSVNLSNFPANPHAEVGVDRRRIYVSTGEEFRLCNGGPLATATLTDAGDRGPILQTGGSTAKPAWVEPPDDMTGMIELWSGMHGAFFKKQYLTCQPFNPHAWPLQYRRQVPDRIVGSAKWGQNWLLATTGLPRVVMGTTPLAMVDAPRYFREACLSKRSVVGVGHGVCWASSRGLCYHGQLGTKVLTEFILTQAQWRALVPETIIGACWHDWYIGFYNDGTRRAFMINTQRPQDGIIFVAQGAYAVFSDPLSDTLYLLDAGNVIKKWDAGTVGSATYRSRVFRHPRAVCPGAARIIATTVRSVCPNWLTAAWLGTTRSGSLAKASMAGPISPIILPTLSANAAAAAIDFGPKE